MRSEIRLGTLWLGLLALTAQSTACGDINIRDGAEAGYSYCQDIGGRYRFRALIPPWEYFKEYRCSSWNNNDCIGTWNPTGRYVFVVSDVPFVNYDSEIVTSLEIEQTTGSTLALANNYITTEAIGQAGSVATFWGDSNSYPAESDVDEGTVSGHEVTWRQERTFEGQVFEWHRRNVWLKKGNAVYHLKFFSIETLDRPEFDTLIRSFQVGPFVDEVDTENCKCRDEHDPSGPQDC